VQFPQTLITEITVPNNVPFTPGHDVIGIGTDVPPELVAAGFGDSIVIYGSDWNPANTTPTVKFRFISSGFSSLAIGFGYCANPSVSQVATVVTTTLIGAQIQGSNIFTTQRWRNLNNQDMFNMGQFGTFEDPLFQMFDQAAVVRAALFHLQSTATTTLAAGNNWQLNIADGATVAAVNGPINKDSAWQAFTLFNGWFGNTAPDQPLYRMMNDGTVQFTGLINKGSAPVNGEQWGSVAAGYLPLKQAGFHACSNLTADGNQKIVIDATGKCVIYDSPAGNGSAFLSGIRYASTLIP
jgi:hypothetical protein